MLDKVMFHILREQLLEKGQKVVAAVSGGQDSMVLLDILNKSGFEVIVAHCNFHLRGQESDDDQAFVKAYCQEQKIHFESKSFDLHIQKEASNASTQMLARAARYDWFNELSLKYNAPIAVAHHLEDQIETFFINLSRGSGISGITGIKSRNKNIIRPCIKMAKSEIQTYCQTHNIPFREDSSNNSDDYLRNRIRHHLTPVLKDIFQNFESTMLENFSRWQGEKEVLNNHINEVKEQISSLKDGQLRFENKQLLKLTSLSTYLFHWLSEYKFNNNQCNDIYNCLLNHVSGKQFLSPTHRIVIDRVYTILTALENKEPIEYIISNKSEIRNLPIGLNMKVYNKTEDWVIDKSARLLQGDAEKVTFPIICRKWKHGDRFIPFGMNTHQKVSDYFSDHKFSLIDKENTWLMESNNQIVWIVGHRISDVIKITPSTQEIIEIALL